MILHKQASVFVPLMFMEHEPQMPSLQELMDDTADDEERALMKRVAKKMGIGDRGALVPGTGLAAVEMLQKLGTDPSLWSDGSDDEDERLGTLLPCRTPELDPCILARVRKTDRVLLA